MDTETKPLCTWTIAELETAANHAPNRYMAACYRQLAHAKTQLALGNNVLAGAHYARSKAAFEAAQADEAAQVSAAMQKQRANEKAGIAVKPIGGYAYGESHVSMREQYTSMGERRSLATSASVSK